MPADTYFRAVAIDIFTGALEGLGARLVGDDPWVARFEADRWFVEVVALREDGPKYSPRVEIGPLPEFSGDPARNRFDILHTLPEASPLRRYNLLWRYMDEAGMRAAYVRVLKELFEPFAIDVLCDAGLLKGLMRELTEQLDREWHAEIRDHNERVSRGRAANALLAQDYRTYLHEMGQIPPDRLSPAERARFDYVRKKARKSGP